MDSMQIDFIDPKVKKVILGLQTMGLVKLSKKTSSSTQKTKVAPTNELTNEFIERLDKEYELFKSGKGKYFSMNEVFDKYMR